MTTSAERRPRRTPHPDERQRDAERSRQALLSTAVDEFATKGFAGARVQDIAQRAGVNKQLITYYFGGKEGLYREIQRRWAEREAAIADPGLPLEEIAARYLRAALDDPRFARLTIWRGLTGDSEADGAELEAIETAVLDRDVANLRAARSRGEIAADLDPGFLRLALMAMILAPALLQRTARQLTGIGPDTEEFKEYYGEQLRRLVRHLGATAEQPEQPGESG
jgi:AcrR family transcriptional regulator